MEKLIGSSCIIPCNYCEHKKDCNEAEVQSKKADEDFNSKIAEARTDTNKAIDLYKEYVGSAETIEERKRRINNFRCGGY